MGKSGTKSRTSSRVSGNRKPHITVGHRSPEKQISDPMWIEAIERLHSRTFDSMPEAVDAVIDQVLQKIPPQRGQEEETKDFLRLLFDIDPTLEESLRSVCRIRE